MNRRRRFMCWVLWHRMRFTYPFTFVCKRCQWENREWLHNPRGNQTPPDVWDRGKAFPGRVFW